MIRRGALAESQIAAAFASNPRSQNPQFDFEVIAAGDAAISAAIDRQNVARSRAAGIDPAPPVDDAQFLRRVTLDLAGRIPTVAEVDAFLADDSPDKRSRRIDALLSSREMPYYWSHVLSNWLMPESAHRDEGFVSCLRSGLAKNKQGNQFVREMLIARPTGERVAKTGERGA